MMIFPEEVVVDNLVPVVRYLMVRELLERGLSEARIGDLLGISQSAVSKYRGRRVRLNEDLLQDEGVGSVARKAAQALAEGRPRMEALSMLISLTREMENRGPVCKLHEEMVPWLGGTGCNLCVTPVGGRVLEEQVILGELRRALTILKGIPGFADLIPNVGSNLAYALEGATDLEEVAAVPGRIYEVRGQVKVPGPPEFGASKHVAEVALAVSSLSPTMRSAINVVWTEAVLRACEALGWDVFEMEASYEGRRERILRGLRERGSCPNVIYHRGDYGIEPITYLLGESPMYVVRRVEALSKALRTRR
jgi:predicted fused transcriptional regulator/phosphomethylpyrimidine kinase/predicted transcriptional regulator